MKKVIELIRVSTEGQAADDRASIPAQRAINRRTAQTYGLQIVESVEMADVSGAAVLAAPEMQRLLERIGSRDIHGVVTREFSRLMRPDSFSDYAILQRFMETATVLYLPDGPMDLTNKTGRLMGTIRAAIAGLERSEILERIWSAKEEKRKAGGFAQAEVCLPFGVGYDQQRGWYYKPEAERVREAFRRFLAGEQSYNTLARMVGVTPRGMHLIMRNPIYSGWRVIDTKRDPNVRLSKADGRQGDRPKIMRAPEEVIRKRVITPGLISESDFATVQERMNAKQQYHWRTHPEQHEHFVYGGFLACAACDSLVYTYTNRNENRYYVCKAKQYPKAVGKKCGTAYMRRDLLEAQLDFLFVQRFTDHGFLSEIASELEQRAKARSNGSAVLRLKAQIKQLGSKRERVMDAYFEGTISREERDTRLVKIDRDLTAAREGLAREVPAESHVLGVQELDQAFQPFHEWMFLGYQDKRRLLTAAGSQIRVADYRVDGLFVNLPAHQYESTRSDRDSSPP